jgi:hypothetical protein
MLRPDIWRLESAALKHNTPSVVCELERALGLSEPQARRIIEDDLGEPIVVAAKAMNLPADVLQRILLFMNPRIGQSVDRVYELTSLHGEIGTEAALRLIAILRAGRPAVRAPAPVPDAAAWQSAVDSARRTLSEIATRPAVRQHDTLAQRMARVARGGR